MTKVGYNGNSIGAALFIILKKAVGVYRELWCKMYESTHISKTCNDPVPRLIWINQNPPRVDFFIVRNLIYVQKHFIIYKRRYFMGKFLKLVDLSTDEKKKEFFELLDSKKSMNEVYKEFDLNSTGGNSKDLYKMAEIVGFDLNVYKKRRYGKKLYCLQCNKELSGPQKKFCSNSCAATYNNLRRKPRSMESREKISKIMKELYGKNDTKKCKICGSINCQNNFCKRHNQFIKYLIKYFGFNQNALGTGLSNVINEYNRIKNELYNLYWVEQLSCRKISYLYSKDIYGKSSYITNVLNIFKIPRRSNRESTSLAILNGDLKLSNKVPNFICTMHETWENKMVFLRSSYELNFAKQLDRNNISYDVECFKIKYYDNKKKCYRCAVPDFYLKDENIIIEIKSIFTYDKQNMLDRFKAYKENGYNCKMIMDGVEYFDYNLPESNKNNINNVFKN